MKQSILFTFLAALLASLPAVAKAQIVQIDGSSTVFPVTEAVAGGACRGAGGGAAGAAAGVRPAAQKSWASS